MIFVSTNERGEKACDLILQKRKTVTRRPKPLPAGKVFAIQSGRGKFAIAYGRVLSCVLDEEWCDEYIPSEAAAEARREGFITWAGLWAWIGKSSKTENRELYRIEFELVSHGDKEK